MEYNFFWDAFWLLTFLSSHVHLGITHTRYNTYIKRLQWYSHVGIPNWFNTNSVEIRSFQSGVDRNFINHYFLLPKNVSEGSMTKPNTLSSYHLPKTHRLVEEVGRCRLEEASAQKRTWFTHPLLHLTAAQGIPPNVYRSVSLSALHRLMRLHF